MSVDEMREMLTEEGFDNVPSVPMLGGAAARGSNAGAGFSSISPGTG